LANHFIRKLAPDSGSKVESITDQAMEKLIAYHWPGNVRELENVVERAVVLSTREEIDVDLLPEAILTRGMLGNARLHLSELLKSLAQEGHQHPAADRPIPSLFEIMEQIERRVIEDMLEQTGWNQTEAAERFQVPLSTLNQKIKRLGIEIRRRSAGRDPADPLAEAAESSR
jgi:DNA-binding NtrC family response regulator